MTNKACPFCGAPYPECEADCYNYKVAELATLTMGRRGGRSVPLTELELAWNTRAEDTTLKNLLREALECEGAEGFNAGFTDRCRAAGVEVAE